MADRTPAVSVSQLMELVDAEWRRLLSAAPLQPPPARGGSNDSWSVSDVLSHVRLYDAWLLGMLEPAQREEQMPYRSYLTPEAEIHARNRHHVEADRALSEEQIEHRALETHSRLREVLARLSDQGLSSSHTVTESGFVPSRQGRSLAELIAIETHWHYADHAADLERVAAQSPELR